MTEREATKTKQHVESKRPMHMGIFYLSKCKSNPGFPFRQMESLCGGPQLCSILRQSRSNTQACCTKQWCLQISSVTDLQKLALTSKRTTVVFFCYLFFLNLPCEKQTPKQTVTYLSCADQILNAVQQVVVMKVSEQ